MPVKALSMVQVSVVLRCWEASIMICLMKMEPQNKPFRRNSGGISNGMDIYFRAAFKPIATILRPQESIDKDGNSVTVEGKGRHDPVYCRVLFL